MYKNVMFFIFLYYGLGINSNIKQIRFLNKKNSLYSKVNVLYFLMNIKTVRKNTSRSLRITHLVLFSPQLYVLFTNALRNYVKAACIA